MPVCPKSARCTPAMNPAEIKVVPVCLCSICCFLTIFAVIALPLSFKSLEQGKYALQLSWHTQLIGDEVYTEPGMYMVGLGNMLVEFPSTLQTMYFVADTRGTVSADADVVQPFIRRGPITARSADGLEMIISLSFQWQLQQKSLKPLYALLGGGSKVNSLYRDEFVRFARAAVVKSCANFAVDLFFTNRNMITADLLLKMREAFAEKEIGVELLVEGLQLREVDVPDAFDQEIILTQEQMQEVEVAVAERSMRKIEMEKKLMLATQRVNKIIHDSQGAAEKTRIHNEAIVTQTINYQKKQAVAFSGVLSKFAYDSDPFARLFEVMEVRALDAHNDKKLLVNL